MYITWLVKHNDRFLETLQPTSELDKSIDYGLSLHEWRAIFLDVLAKDDDDAAKQFIRSHYDCIVELGDPIPAYPLLSYINGLLWDSSFEADEVQPLCDECAKCWNRLTTLLLVEGLRS